MTKIEIDIPENIFEKANKIYQTLNCDLIHKLEKMNVNYIQDTLNEIINLL